MARRRPTSGTQNVENTNRKLKLFLNGKRYTC